MSRTLGFLGVLIVVAAGLYIYSKQIQSTSAPGGTAANPRSTIDVTGVKNDLVSIANAERRRRATDGKYASLDDLISNGDISMQTPSRGPYSYSSDVSDQSFRITATYNGSDPGPKTLYIDESMQIRTE